MNTQQNIVAALLGESLRSNRTIEPQSHSPFQFNPSNSPSFASSSNCTSRNSSELDHLVASLLGERLNLGSNAQTAQTGCGNRVPYGEAEFKKILYNIAKDKAIETVESIGLVKELVNHPDNDILAKVMSGVPVPREALIQDLVDDRIRDHIATCILDHLTGSAYEMLYGVTGMKAKAIRDELFVGRELNRRAPPSYGMTSSPSSFGMPAPFATSGWNGIQSGNACIVPSESCHNWNQQVPSSCNVPITQSRYF